MPPYVLVGHSFGALVARVFAARHVSDVAAMVLVEPAFPEDWLQPNDRERQRIERGVNLCRRGSFAARVGLARMVSWLVNAGALAPARAVVALISRGGVARADEEILAPIWKLPREARGVLKQMWTRAAFFDALGSQIASISQSAAEVIDAGDIDHVPLVIVSATNPHPHHVAMQQQLVNRARQGRRIVASASGHWVPLDQPEVIVDAVRTIVEEIRSP